MMDKLSRLPAHKHNEPNLIEYWFILMQQEGMQVPDMLALIKSQTGLYVDEASLYRWRRAGHAGVGRRPPEAVCYFCRRQVIRAALKAALGTEIRVDHRHLAKLAKLMTPGFFPKVPES